jgi:Na+/melibiose symporter-like transporter
VLAIIAYLACYALVTERVVTGQVGEVREKKSVFLLLGESLRNRALISIIAASIVMLLSQFTLQQMANYVFPDYYANTDAQSVSTLAMMVAMFLAAGGAKPLARRFGKQRSASYQISLPRRYRSCSSLSALQVCGHTLPSASFPGSDSESLQWYPGR